MKKIFIATFVICISLYSGLHITQYSDTQNNLDPFSDNTEIDTDDDGVINEKEQQYGTDPLDADTDGDGLSDGREVEIGTDPTQSDTDGDSISDRKEIEIGTDPLNPDTDDDGLTDTVEVWRDETDPLDADSDKDGLSDGREVEIGTDPTKYDSSGDGLSDGYAYHTEYLDPTRLNITVVVHTNTDIDISGAMYRLDTEVFTDAPVESDLGKQGINFTILDAGTVTTTGEFTYNEYLTEVYTPHFDRNGNGVYHAYITPDVYQSYTGFTSDETDGMLIEEQGSREMATTLLHELGHQLGLDSDVYTGIDSTQYKWEQYPSVMNYSNIDCSVCSYTEEITFSNGTGHDDWAYINQHIRTNLPPTNEIDTCIENKPTLTERQTCFNQHTESSYTVIK
jgi:hypothetical protein